LELDRYTELLNALRRWRDIFAENLRIQIENDPKLEVEANNIYRGEGVGENFGSWLERFCRQLAIQFILKTLFIRVLEDRGLLKPYRIRTRDSQQLFQTLTSYLGTTGYLRFVFRDTSYLLPDIFAERSQDIVWPADELSDQFIEEIWRRDDVDRDDWLRFDFRGNGDQGFDSRFIGDIYQDIDAEAREYYALLQTPHFISQFILDHTLDKRFEEKNFRKVTLIDPTCGSGHFLVDAFERFVTQYTSAGDFGIGSGGKAKLARHIIEKHLFGADLNPYACTLARFRLMLAACDFAHPIDLEAFRNQHFNIVHCDSLIPYEDEERISTQRDLGQSIEEADDEHRNRFGSQETILFARKLFSRKYDVVVGNPPYITVKDAFKRNFYRTTYESAYRKYGLAAPFIERFIKLAQGQENAGHIGAIVTNAIATRLYGKKLIENVLPQYDLKAVVDLSGVYIPGHGTPTLIVLAKNQPQHDDKTLVVSNLKGESGTPTNPAQGNVWLRVVEGFAKGHGYQDEYVDVYEQSLETLRKHPWQFSGPSSRLLYQIIQKNPNTLENISDAVGVILMTNADEVYRVSDQFARKRNLRKIKPFVIGESIRDWEIRPHGYAVFPYDDDLSLIDIEEHKGEEEYLQKYRKILEKRVVFGGETYKEAQKPWYGYHQISSQRLRTPLNLIVFAFISTHNHFVLSNEVLVFNRSAQIIKLKSDDTKYYQLITGILNSTLGSLFIKERCFNKGAGNDPVRDRYEISATSFGKFPLPEQTNIQQNNRKYLISLAKQISKLAKQSSSLSMRKIFIQEDGNYHKSRTYFERERQINITFSEFSDVKSLNDTLLKVKKGRKDIRSRMMFIQEEIDWLTYEMFGLIHNSPLAGNYLSTEEIRIVKLELGQRAFEQIGNSYKGDWPESWHKGSQGHLPGPAANLPELSKNMSRLIQDRMEIIKSNKDIALIEDPLYKRRWIPPNYSKEFQDSLEWWVREMAEWELEQAGQPLHIREWCRRLMQSERIRAALEVYTGTPNYDSVMVIEKIIRREAVPNRPEHYFKQDGLRKLARGEQEFTSGDFSDNNVWKVRGKLNIPRERYIAYTDLEPGWYGWAGWNAEQRAEALVMLIQEANQQGLSILHHQCGLMASLRELLPELGNLPPGEQREFKDIAFRCGIQEDCFCQAFQEADANMRPPGFGKLTIKKNDKKGNSQMALF